MTYSLLWSEPLSIFALACYTTASHKTMAKGELRESFKGDPVLNQWADFAKANPGKQCVYDMLPPTDPAHDCVAASA